MSKTEPNKDVAAIAIAEQMGNQLKGDIIAGTIEKGQAQVLYNAFKDIKLGKNRAAAVQKLCDNLYKDAGPDKFHNFVKLLAEVEKDEVNRAHPTPHNPTPAQIKSLQVQRGADFYRNASLARNAMIFECAKEGLGKETFEALKNNDLAKGAATLSDIKIPERVVDTYKSINEFYKENKLDTGAAKNLTFHAINGAIQLMGVADGATHPERSQEEKQEKHLQLQKDLNKVAVRGVFDKESPGSLDLVIAQIEGKKPTTQQIENSKAITQKVQAEVAVTTPTPSQTNQTAAPSAQPNKDTPNTAPKSPGFFDKVKAFAKEAVTAIKDAVTAIKDAVIPGRKKWIKRLMSLQTSQNPLQKNTLMTKPLRQKVKLGKKLFLRALKLSPRRKPLLSKPHNTGEDTAA